MTTLHDLHGLYLYGKLALGALAFLGLVGVAVAIWVRVLAVRFWPQATGIIVVSEVDVTTMDITGADGEPYVSRYPIIEYTYEVGGRQYRSRKIGILADGDRDADDLVAKFSKGSQVMVFYKPSDPGNCIIDHHIPRTQRNELIIMIVAAASIGIFCIFEFTSAAEILRAVLPH